MKQERKQYKTVVIYRDNLVYDINFESWKIARMRIDDKTVQMETSTDEEADMFIERHIDSAINNIKTSMLWCLDRVTRAAAVSTNKLSQDWENPSQGPHYEPDTSMPVDDTLLDATQTDWEEHTPEPAAARFRTHYDFGFVFSSYWMGDIDAVKSAIHNYMRCRVLTEWFALVKPDEAARYERYATRYLLDAVTAARQERADGITFRL